MTGALLTALAIVGGTVHTGDGQVLENATVVVEGDRVVAIGAVETPKGATVLDARGKVVTPGLVDAVTTLGLVEISGVGPSNDTNMGGPHLVRAANRATDSYNPWSPVVASQRVEGVTTIVATPVGGLLSGQSAAYDLVPGPPVRAPVAIHGFLGGRDGGARGAALLKLREVLEDARRYGKDRKAFEQRRFREVAAGRLDLDALQPIVRGKLPLNVAVHRRADILTVLRIAAEERVRLVLVGATEAWMVAEQIAAAKVPVIVDASANLPSNFDMVHARSDAAALLHRAGVKVVLSTFDAHNVRKLRQWAGNAVRDGLPHAEALKAVTSAPAEVLGIPDRGVLAKGKIANLVVWSGDPFELSTRAEQVVVQGRPVPANHRQRALFERYRTVPPPY